MNGELLFSLPYNSTVDSLCVAASAEPLGVLFLITTIQEACDDYVRIFIVSYFNHLDLIFLFAFPCIFYFFFYV